MSLRYGLLGLINITPTTGYELDKEFKESLKYIWHAKSSQIYAELDNMERRGWLASERVIQEDKPNKRVYSITEQGREELMTWMMSYEDDVQNSLTGKNAFLFRVLLAGSLSNEQALKLLNLFREVCLARKSTQADIRGLIDQDKEKYGSEQAHFFELVALHGEMMNQTRLAWIEKAINIVENGGT